MKSKNYKSRTFLLLVVLTLIAIICYQEPTDYSQAYYAKEFLEDKAIDETVLAEMKFLKLVLEHVVHSIR